MASRSIDALHPKVRGMALKFLDACKTAGIDILIYCTYRSPEEQNDLYAQGRSRPGKVVTNARGGESYHNWCLAFDWVPVLGGKPQWSDTDLYRKAGVLAESVGLEWAGRWTGALRETAHCQFTGGLKIADLKAGKELKC